MTTSHMKATSEPRDHCSKGMTGGYDGILGKDMEVRENRFATGTRYLV